VGTERESWTDILQSCGAILALDTQHTQQPARAVRRMTARLRRIRRRTLLYERDQLERLGDKPEKRLHEFEKAS